ncbi:MAG: alkaline phosphatase family protein [Planctomycetes bacterium]|nr:alkaline phosphatase family protein [Planctomycetota bacterium]
MTSDHLVFLSIANLRSGDIDAHTTPTLYAWANSGALASLTPTFPALTSCVQASMWTGLPPDQHGVIANGFFHRDRSEVEFWVARNGIINADGWLTKENMNVQPDGIGKFYWMPVNYTVVRPGMDRLLPVAGGNNNNEQRAKIAEAHKPLFEATIARMMRVEASAVERARKREAGIAGWAGAFYADHAVKLRAALIPCVEALGVSLRLTVDGRFTDQEWDQRIGSFTAAHVHGMIEQSRESVLQGGEPVLDAAELSRLIVSGMLELVTGVTKHENA